MAAPFQQGRFEDLPAKPRVAHRYYDSEALEVRFRASGWPDTTAHVRRYGEGPPLLLIHGLMTSSYSWRYAFEHFGERFTCLAPDLPGAGRSSAPLDVRYGPRELGVWLAALQRELGVRGCAAIGNSMGGYVTMRLALDDPEALSRLCVLHAPGVADDRMAALAVALSLPGAKPGLAWFVRRRPLRWAHANVHYWDESLKSLEEAHEYGGPLSTPAGSEAFVKYLDETMAVRPMRRFERELRARREAGQAFPVPLQLVYAERDPMVPPRVGDLLAGLIPDASFTRMKEASHFAHVDAAERFAAVALPFLEGDA